MSSLRQWLEMPGMRQFLALVGLALFIAGSWLSIERVMSMGADFHLMPVTAVVLCLAPLTMHLAIRRFQWIAGMAGLSLSYYDSSRVVVIGGLANILPLPGAFLVRFAYLAECLGVKNSTRVNLMAALMWGSCAICIAAVFLALEGFVVMAGVFFLAALASAGLAWLQAVRAAFYKPGRGLCRLALLQSVMTMVNIMRIVVISHAFDLPLSALVGSLMAVTGVAASMTGVFPAGLGLAELLAASIASLMALPPALGFLVTSVNRLASWLVLTIYIPVALRGRREVPNNTKSSMFVRSHAQGKDKPA